MNESSVLDPRLIWQNQAREHPAMSLQEIRVRANIAHSKVRRNLILTFVIAIGLLVLCSITIATITMTSVRIISAAIMFFVVVIARDAYGRVRLSQAQPRQAALSACLDFYRNELQAQYRTVYVRWRL